jgi:D-3-phosphoglycerate dehydrogenase
MVARVDDFDKLYFEPKGPMVGFVYRDRPGVLGKIGAAMAAANINIDDVRNPHDSKGEKSLAILKVNRAVPEDVLRKAARDIEAEKAFAIEL